MKDKIIVIDESSLYELVEKIVGRLRPTNSSLDSDDVWLDEKEAMELLKIKSKATLFKYRSEGRITYSQLTRKKVLYLKASLLEFLQRKARNTF